MRSVMSTPTPLSTLSAADVRLRRATPADAEELARLRWADSTEDGTVPQQSCADFCAHFATFVRAALAGGQWTIWVAEGAGRIVAHIYVCAVPKAPRPDRAVTTWGYTTAVYAVPEVRNSGIGSCLLRRVVAWAEAERLECLHLWHSERSVPFYERAGFARPLDVLERPLGG